MGETQRWLHPPTDRDRIDVVAHDLYERNRRQIPSFPAWDDLDMTDPGHANLIRLGYDWARDFLVTSSTEEG
jgi:hypothetical protein